MTYQFNRTNSNEDARLAADMQLAYDIQAEEEESQIRELMRQQQQQAPNAVSSSRSSHSHSRAATSRSTFDYPANRTSRHELPIVQGQFVPAPFPFYQQARNRSNSSAQAAIHSDGLSMRQNQSLIYVPAEINDRVVEMMVDTGAQSSVISTKLMKTLGLESRLNRRMQGIAQGVGQARIVGVIENCPVQIGHVEFLLYFLVLDVNQDMIILGIDQMRRFKCQIDLEHNKLVFGGKDGVEVSFLPSDEAPAGRSLSIGCPIS